MDVCPQEASSCMLGDFMQRSEFTLLDSSWGELLSLQIVSAVWVDEESAPALPAETVGG